MQEPKSKGFSQYKVNNEEAGQLRLFPISGYAPSPSRSYWYPACPGDSYEGRCDLEKRTLYKQRHAEVPEFL